jgi:hypothetical protein
MSGTPFAEATDPPHAWVLGTFDGVGAAVGIEKAYSYGHLFFADQDCPMTRAVTWYTWCTIDQPAPLDGFPEGHDAGGSCKDLDPGGAVSTPHHHEWDEFTFEDHGDPVLFKQWKAFSGPSSSSSNGDTYSSPLGDIDASPTAAPLPSPGACFDPDPAHFTNVDSTPAVGDWVRTNYAGYYVAKWLAVIDWTGFKYR